MRRIGLALLFSMVAVLLTPQLAQAHVERPSYWPNPAPDCSISPCAGGAVPTARSLASALRVSPPGRTRVVCKQNSLAQTLRAVGAARRHGFSIRPTDHRALGKGRARQLIRVNTRLFARCGYHQIQPAVTASHNNDRVVIMPGVYTEPTARSQPEGDRSCKQYRTHADSGDPGALSHAYQLNCPNDANLIAVIGRGVGPGQDPDPPLTNRHGIPNLGKCIRCNLQIEGSGVGPDDVVIEAGSKAAGNGGPSAVGHKKDVGVFVDQADGFVLRNVTIRHAREHDIYVLETDGYLLDRFKVFYAGGYGVLTFVEDHGVMQNCEAVGNGDSGLYPGSGADSTDHRYKKFYPKYRYSQVVRFCDSHHNSSGFSGTDSHGTLITHNNFYDNALGFTTDVFTGAGHPGFPQHGNVLEHNNFYRNNFNPFKANSDVEPFIAAPVGTGLWIAGGNANILRNNHVWDNWRRGVMTFGVPDATVCGPEPIGGPTPVPGCDPLGTSTSYNNRFHGNTMGVSPTGKIAPNGLDFWWDSFAGNTGNCWWGNKSAPGTSVTTSPAILPDCAGGTDPSTSIGTGDLVNEGELIACLAGFQVSGYPAGNPTLCTWSATPPKPGTGPGLPISARTPALSKQQGAWFASICAAGLSPRTCAPYQDLLSASFGPASAVANRFFEPAIAAASRIVPVASTGPLSSFTCSWWRQADEAHRLGMVQRIRHFATGPIDGATSYGFGAGMSDTRATALFTGRCSFSQAGPFALYKIYGAAAPFSAVSR